MTTAMNDATVPASARRWMRSRTARAAGIATTALAGALSMMITTPQAAADTSAADASLQPAINNLLDAMQLAVTQDEALPFFPPGLWDVRSLHGLGAAAMSSPEARRNDARSGSVSP